MCSELCVVSDGSSGVLCRVSCASCCVMAGGWCESCGLCVCVLRVCVIGEISVVGIIPLLIKINDVVALATLCLSMSFFPMCLLSLKF